mmetsp:Transcript_17060/g.49259  ORF Transcript_17060/g.49259 Transcript_17060/m.49259 type:complete len:200 (-) Transcript_17060:1217-1816(-)
MLRHRRRPPERDGIGRAETDRAAVMALATVWSTEDFRRQGRRGDNCTGGATVGLLPGGANDVRRGRHVGGSSSAEWGTVAAGGGTFPPLGCLGSARSRKLVHRGCFRMRPLSVGQMWCAPLATLLFGSRRLPRQPAVLLVCGSPVPTMLRVSLVVMMTVMIFAARSVNCLAGEARRQRNGRVRSEAHRSVMAVLAPRRR